MASDSPLTTWGATRTTFFTTTITAPTNTKAVSIYYPIRTITAAPELTTLRNSWSGEYTVLPVLVLTDVVGVVVSTDGVPLKTGTLVQPVSSQETAVGNGTAIPDHCSAWSCWSVGQQAGTGVGIAVAAIVILAGLMWLCCCKPRKRTKDVEDGAGREKVVFGWVGGPAGGRNKGGSVDFGDEGHKRATIVEIPPAVHGGASRYRVVPPTPREAIRRAAEMPPEPVPPPAGPTPREAIRRAAEMPPEPVPPPAGPLPIRQLSKGRTEIPPDPSPSTKRASQRSSYYYPKTHDFAYAAAGAAGAGIAAESRPRGRSPQSRRQATKEVRTSKAWAPSALPITKHEEIPRRKSKRQSRREDSGDRDTRREDRKRDSDRERGSGRERGPERESREARGGRNKPREFRNEPRVSRERRASSASPPRKPRSKSVPQKRASSGNSKWLALLPLALKALHDFTEPEGGWEQYHKDSSKTKDRKRKSRSYSRSPSESSNEHRYNASSQPRPSYRARDSAGAFAGGHTESRPRRSRSADAARRDSSPDGFTPRREDRRMNEVPQRGPPVSRDSRSRSGYKAYYDGAMSSSDEGYYGSGSMVSDSGDENRHATSVEEARKPQHRLTV